MVSLLKQVIVTSMRYLSESVPGVTAAEQIGALSDADAHIMLQYLEPRFAPYRNQRF